MGRRHGEHAGRAFATVVAAAALALLAPAGPATASAATTCNLVAATDGSDSNPGTAAQPLRSPGRLAAALAPGQTGCLREGTYSWSGDLSIRTASITLTSFGEEQAVMQGRVRIEATATGAVLEGLVLDGRNPGNELSPLIYASQVVLRDNEITNHHTGICIHLDRYYDNPVPTNVVIEGNRIHDCGALPANNFDHGIYVGKAEGTVIRDNWIYDNANRGIQLYSQAQHTQITGNVIDGNGQGVIFGGEQSNPSSNNVVEGNVISNSKLRDNVESSWGGSPGTGNVVRGNCIGGGTYDEGDGGILSAPNRGFAENGNTIAEPEFVNRSAGDLSLVPGSVCDQVLNGGVAPPPEPGELTLEAGKDELVAGQQLILKGASRGVQTVRLMIRRTGKWHLLENVGVHGERGRYRVHVRVHRSGRARFKAEATGAKASKPVRVEVHRRKR